VAQDPLSLRAYAQHRKALGLPGTTLKSVQKALDAERISFVLVGGQKRIPDPEAADREWAVNTDPMRSRGAQDGDGEFGEDGDQEAYKGASARERHWKAQLAELTYRQRAGELVNAAEVQAAIAETFSTVRTRLLGLPSKAKQRLPHLSFTDLAAIEAMVREDLEELVEPETDA
jgi:phage terminase Nu1 subunit (DNA packaging protein)